MRNLFIYILTLLLLVNLALSSHYFYAKVALAGTDSSSNNIHKCNFWFEALAQELPFIIDHHKIQYGKTYGAPLYKLQIDDNCVLETRRNLPDWCAVYIEVPPHCRHKNRIIKKLETEEIDFIFMNIGSSIENFRINRNGIGIPVFILDSSAQVDFINQLETIFNQDVNDDQTPAERSYHISIEMPYVIYNS